MQLKNILNAAALILLTACGGGGGGAAPEPITPAPIPTPPPAPQDYNVNFYYGERIDYFKACIDLNLNDRCDEGEISTDTFENPEYNNHSFTLTTSDGNLQNFLEQYKRPYLIEVGEYEYDVVKNRHPGHLYLRELGISEEVNMNTFTTAITPTISWIQTPWWFFEGNDNGLTELLEYEIYSLLSSRLETVNSLENINNEQFFGGVCDVGNESCSGYQTIYSDTRDNLLAQYFYSLGGFKQTIKNDYSSLLTQEGTTYFGIAIDNLTPNQMEVRLNPEARALRTFLSDSYPNDTTGKYSGLSDYDPFTVPALMQVRISYENLAGAWDGNYTARINTRVIQEPPNGLQPLSASIPGNGVEPAAPYGCDVIMPESGFNDSLCDYEASVDGLFRSAGIAREIYRMDNHQGNVVDSYVDNYFYHNSWLNDYDEYFYYSYCWNYEAAQRTNLDAQNIDIGYRRVEREFYGNLQDGICYINLSSPSYYQYGLASIAGQGDLFILFNSDYGDDEPSSFDGDYFAGLATIESVIEELGNTDGLDASSEDFIEAVEIDLDFVGTLIDRVFQDSLPNGKGGSYVEVLFFPEGSSSYNKFLFNYGGGNDLYCLTDYNNKHDQNAFLDSDVSSVLSRERVQEVFNLCIPYLEFGYTFDNPDNSSPLSPFMGGGAYTNSTSSKDQGISLKGLSTEEKISVIRNMTNLKNRKKFMKKTEDTIEFKEKEIGNFFRHSNKD
mgnify:CR=1 FL=1